jgi:hypothetical protein
MSADSTSAISSAATQLPAVLSLATIPHAETAELPELGTGNAVALWEIGDVSPIKFGTDFPEHGIQAITEDTGPDSKH